MPPPFAIKLVLYTEGGGVVLFNSKGTKFTVVLGKMLCQDQ